MDAANDPAQRAKKAMTTAGVAIAIAAAEQVPQAEPIEVT